MQTDHRLEPSIAEERFRSGDAIHEMSIAGSRFPPLVPDGALKAVAEPHSSTRPDCCGDVERPTRETSLDRGEPIDDNRSELEEERCLREEVRADHHFDAIVGNSPVLRAAMYLVSVVAPTDS